MIEDLIIGEATVVPAIVGPSYLPTIQRGSTGDAVRYAQRVLKERASQAIVVDGIFGSQTEGAVLNLQRFFGLPVTGIVYSSSWAVINFIAAGSVSGTAYNIKDRVISMDVSLTMDSVSQLTFEVSDPGLVLADANYWNIRRPVRYRGMRYEISAYEISQGEAGEVVRVEARNAACQLLKRNKGPSVFTEGNATVYASTKAREVGLKFFGENTVEQTTISQTSTTTSDESVWDVLKRLAGQYQYVIFESDGRLFFTSQKFLLGKYALVDSYTTSGYFSTPIRWRTEPSPATTYQAPIPAPATSPTLSLGSTGDAVRYVQTVYSQRAGFSVSITGVYDTSTQLVTTFFQLQNRLLGTGIVDSATWAAIRYLGGGREIAGRGFSIKALECPRCRKSDDDTNAAEISFQVEKLPGTLLRPGMTVKLADIPDFTGNYVITEVRWDEGVVGSVAVTARTPVEPTAPATTVTSSGPGDPVETTVLVSRIADATYAERQGYPYPTSTSTTTTTTTTSTTTSGSGGTYVRYM